MKKNLSFLLIVAFIAITFVYSCSDDDDATPVNPTLSLSLDDGFVYSDSAFTVGAAYKIKVISNSNGGSNLSNLEVTVNETNNVLNFGLNALELEKEVILTKTDAEVDNVEIIIRNIDGLTATKTLVINKLENPYGEISHFANLILGGQSNANVGSFIDAKTGIIYKQAEAFNNQALIDILYYFDGSDANTLSSAGGNITGIFTGTTAPENWEVKNTTTYSRTPLTITDEDFINCNNDSLIVANIFTDGGRKAKQLEANKFWAFQIETGKYGILKINAVDGEAAGTVSIDIKIQQ